MYQFINSNDPETANYNLPPPTSAVVQTPLPAIANTSNTSVSGTESNFTGHRCVKRRRSSYTIEFKVHVVEAFRHSNQQNVSKIATEFGIDRKRVREWNYTYDKLKKMNGDLQKRRRKVEFSRQVRSREIEEGVLHYYYQQRAAGHRVKNKDLQQIALYIAHNVGIPDFKASNMWLYRWKKRHQLLNKPSLSATAQRLAQDIPSADRAQTPLQQQQQQQQHYHQQQLQDQDVFCYQDDVDDEDDYYYDDDDDDDQDDDEDDHIDEDDDN